MQYDYRMVDVFSPEPLLGNPVAVIHDATGLSTEQMQAITRWMNLSETTFLLPAEDPQADYRLRIFTLDRELPFAGTLRSAAAGPGWKPVGGHPLRVAWFRSAAPGWSRYGTTMTDSPLPRHP